MIPLDPPLISAVIRITYKYGFYELTVPFTDIFRIIIALIICPLIVEVHASTVSTTAVRVTYGKHKGNNHSVTSHANVKVLEFVVEYELIASQIH